MTDEPEIIARKTGQVGRITLNRPKALNALTHGMCLAMIEALEAWKDDDAVKAVVVDGAGEKGFCAGGDILQLHNSGKAGDDRAWLLCACAQRLCQMWLLPAPLRLRAPLVRVYHRKGGYPFFRPGNDRFSSSNIRTQGSLQARTNQEGIQNVIIPVSFIDSMSG